jgi:hypothetical protein
MARIKLKGFGAIDRRTVAAREALRFKADLISALGGEADLSPQRRRLVDLTVRAAILVDHVDAWLFEQKSLINHRNRSLLPVLVQRQGLAEGLAKLLDRLGLDRVPAKVPTLAEYLAQKYGHDDNGHEHAGQSAPAPSGDATSEAPGSEIPTPEVEARSDAGTLQGPPRRTPITITITNEGAPS